ncbi:MAG: ComEA family DNA-binding protein [Gemmatimonadales bacterium]
MEIWCSCHRSLSLLPSCRGEGIAGACTQQPKGQRRIGSAKARAIVDDRTLNGPYRQLTDLTQVVGIGPAILKRLAGACCCPDTPSRIRSL